jgi:hypothetical protein
VSLDRSRIDLLALVFARVARRARALTFGVYSSPCEYLAAGSTGCSAV